MAFDPEKHVVGPHGFLVDKETGHPIGIVAPPVERVTHETDWPKWVKVHESHIAKENDHVSVPLFPEYHVNRANGEVTVLVKDEDEEKLALHGKQEPVIEQPVIKEELPPAVE